MIDLRAPGGADEGQDGLQLRAVQIRNVSDSVLLLGEIQGSVMLHHCDRCIIVVRCRQVSPSGCAVIGVAFRIPVDSRLSHDGKYRMHDSSETVCLLATDSTITLEGCRELKIGPIPQQAPQPSHKVHDTLDVQDFDHISSLGDSPNWQRASARQLQSASELLLASPTAALAAGWRQAFDQVRGQ